MKIAAYLMLTVVIFSLMLPTALAQTHKQIVILDKFLRQTSALFFWYTTTWDGFLFNPCKQTLSYQLTAIDVPSSLEVTTSTASDIIKSNMLISLKITINSKWYPTKYFVAFQFSVQLTVKGGETTLFPAYFVGFV